MHNCKSVYLNLGAFLVYTPANHIDYSSGFIELFWIKASDKPQVV